jgi:hypothetical protein
MTDPCRHRTRTQAKLIEYLRPLSWDERERLIAEIKAVLFKPHVRKTARGWRADMGDVRGHEKRTWTQAVAYAREWHANVYGWLLEPHDR